MRRRQVTRGKIRTAQAAEDVSQQSRRPLESGELLKAALSPGLPLSRSAEDAKVVARCSAIDLNHVEVSGAARRFPARLQAADPGGDLPAADEMHSVDQRCTRQDRVALQLLSDRQRALRGGQPRRRPYARQVGYGERVVELALCCAGRLVL